MAPLANWNKQDHCVTTGREDRSPSLVPRLIVPFPPFPLSVYSFHSRAIFLCCDGIARYLFLLRLYLLYNILSAVRTHAVLTKHVCNCLKACTFVWLMGAVIWIFQWCSTQIIYEAYSIKQLKIHSVWLWPHCSSFIRNQFIIIFVIVVFSSNLQLVDVCVRMSVPSCGLSTAQ